MLINIMKKLNKQMMSKNKNNNSKYNKRKLISRN